MENLFIGIDLGGTKIYSAIANEKGQILDEIILKTEANKGAKSIVEKIKKSINYLIDRVDNKNVLAIGIGSPGPLDVKNGLIVEPANLPFKNYNIVKELEEEFGIKVFLDNDANVATLAEYKFGAGLGKENLIYVTASTGIGGGAILNGKLYRGSTSNALELGHTTINVSGRRCGCGNKGCVEALSSGTAISNLAKESLDTRIETTLRNYEVVSAKEVFAEYKNGDKVSVEILEEALSYLGIAISNYANIFDPDIIVIGGGVSNEWEIVSEKINKEMEKRCLSTIYNNCKVVKSKLDSKSGVLGAIALAITSIS